MNPSSSVASRLHPLQRQEIAVKVLSKQEPITQIAHQEQVSRKFIYQQKAIAQEALNQAFDKPKKDNEVLYYLPVTQSADMSVDKSLNSHLSLFLSRSYRIIKGFIRLFYQYRHDSQPSNGSSAKSPKNQSRSRFIVH